jgi:hypothetical protein
MAQRDLQLAGRSGHQLLNGRGKSLAQPEAQSEEDCPGKLSARLRPKITSVVIPAIMSMQQFHRASVSRRFSVARIWEAKPFQSIEGCDARASMTLFCWLRRLVSRFWT